MELYEKANAQVYVKIDLVGAEGIDMGPDPSKVSLSMELGLEALLQLLMMDAFVFVESDQPHMTDQT